MQITILAVVAAASCAPQAHQLPAGVSHAQCPNYPLCDNAALHKQAPEWNQWNAQPAHDQWNAQPQWNAPAPQQQWSAPAHQQWAPAPVHQKAAQYPAGVDPSKCPNFPICDNAALHNQAPAAGHWQQPSQQQWNAQPQWNAPALNGPYNNHIGSTAGGDKYPAGVDPHSCPNYPYCA